MNTERGGGKGKYWFIMIYIKSDKAKHKVNWLAGWLGGQSSFFLSLWVAVYFITCIRCPAQHMSLQACAVALDLKQPNDI